jgi:excisionase family DNA binding protein
MTIDRCTPLADMPTMLRVPEAADWLDLSPGAVFELCRRGELEHVRLGRLIRIPRRALAAMANGHADAD